MYSILKIKRLEKQILKHFSTYFCVFLYICFVSLYGLYTSVQTAHASEEKTVFLELELFRHSLGNYPTGIYFIHDTDLCKQAYGENWAEKCYAALGETGMPVKGIKTHNVPEGEWVWNSPKSIKFILTGDWKASVDMDQKYEIDLTSLPIPAHMQLSQKILTSKYTTRGANVEDGTFFFDSSQNANHAISFTIHFTESIDENIRKDIEERTTLHKIKGDNVKIGKQNWTWFKDNTKAVVYAPILQLPKNYALVILTLYDIGTLHDDGTIHGDAAGNEVFITKK